MYPYRGPLCEECERGFTLSKDRFSHAVCSVDLSRCSADVCNNHGQCIEAPSRDLSNVVCQCDAKYAGRFCEKCKDSRFAYPDCDSEELSSDIYSSQKPSPDFMQRAKYNKGGYETTSL